MVFIFSCSKEVHVKTFIVLDLSISKDLLGTNFLLL